MMLHGLGQGCQTHSLLPDAFTYLDFKRARLYRKKFKQARLYISGRQTFLSAGTETS